MSEIAERKKRIAQSPAWNVVKKALEEMRLAELESLAVARGEENIYRQQGRVDMLTELLRIDNAK
jgi:hypothetical protein